MRIAIFHELHRGGARRSVNEIAKHLRKKHTVDLYIVDAKKDENEESYFTSVNFFRFIPKKWRGGDWKVRLYKDTLELIKLYYLHKRIGRDINKNMYDAIIIHPSQWTQAPFILQFIKGIKLYYCQEPLRIVYDRVHAFSRKGSVKYVYEKIIREGRRLIDKRNIAFAFMVLTNSQFSKRNIKKAYGISSEVCYLGVDSKIFRPRVDKRDIDILFIGTEQKAEGGDLFEKIKQEILDSYTIKVLDNTKEWVSEKKLLEYYQRTKIVLCLARNEPFGLIPLEAAACGCVTIAIDEGGHKETIIDGKTGYLLSPDAKVIAKKIISLLSRPKSLKKISKQAREHIVKNWSWEKSAKETEEIIIKAIYSK